MHGLQKEGRKKMQASTEVMISLSYPPLLSLHDCNGTGRQTPSGVGGGGTWRARRGRDNRREIDMDS